MHFEIRNSYKNIGRGGFPQSQNIHLEQGKTVHDKDFIWNIGDSSFPDFTPNIGTLIIQNGAKLTDFISSATISSGFIVSSKVKLILEKFNLAPTRFYSCSLSHKGTIINEYYFLHTLNNTEIDIDFTRSVFQVKRFEEVIDRIVFRDFNELQNKTKELNEAIEYYTLQYESIFIKQSKNEKLDLFKLGDAGYGTYISNKLREAFEDAKLSGINYREAKIYYS